MSMLPPKLKELADSLEETRKETFGMVSGLSERDFAWSPAGEWSIAVILEHLILAETGTSKVIRKMLKENAGTLPPYPADDSVLKVREIPPPSGKVMAPEAAQPKGPARGKDAILASLVECRVRMLESLAMLAGADPRGAEFPHPRFGAINLYEWPVLTIRSHERDHQLQIAGILRALGT